MRYKLGIACLALGVLTGCITLDPVADTTRYYVLPGPPEAAANTPDALVVGLQPLVLPDYLDRREVVVQRSATEVVYLDDHRWADGLAAAMERSLIQHLQSHENVREVDPAPWTHHAFDRTLLVNIHQCQGAEHGEASLVASWEVQPGNHRNQATFSGTYPKGDHPALIETLGRLLGDLAAAIQADL